MPLILSILFGLRSSPLGMLGYQGSAVELEGPYKVQPPRQVFFQAAHLC